MENRISRRAVMRTLGASAAAVALGACSTPASGQESTSTAGAAMPWREDGTYVLPPLPYAYDALAPFLSETTLTTHHDKHHQGYVNGLNNAMKTLAEAREAGDYGQIKALSRALAFHGSGHMLHTLFWNSMKPGGSEMPDKLADMATRDFGSVEAMQTQFAAATKAVEASGWGILAVEAMSGRLVVLQAEKHQNLTIWGCTPVLVCDVWEHAYYIDYKNARGAFVDGFMKVANWEFASAHV